MYALPSLCDSHQGASRNVTTLPHMLSYLRATSQQRNPLFVAMQPEVAVHVHLDTRDLFPGESGTVEEYMNSKFYDGQLDSC